MESKVDKLDLDELVAVPVNFSKLSDAVKNYFIKKDVHNSKKKILEIEYLILLSQLLMFLLMFHEIPNITNLATTTALTAVENKIPNSVIQSEKADYDKNY